MNNGDAIERILSMRRALKIAREIARRFSLVAPEVSKGPYAGILAEPMLTISISVLKKRPYWYDNDDAHWAKEVELLRMREDQAYRDRLTALGAWYGIKLTKDPNPGDCYHELLFALIEAHVPGFAIADELGAKLPGKGAPPPVASRSDDQPCRVCV